MSTPAAARSCGDCGAGLDRPHALYCDRCRPAHRGKPRLYRPTPAIDAEISGAYLRFWTGCDRQALKACASRVRWPHWAVKKRGRELGFARASENRPWDPCEEALLLGWAHHSDATIVRKLREAGHSRTATAVHLKIKRQRIRATLDGYSGRSLAEAFGVDDHKIQRWIAAGQLKGERREQARTPQQGGNAWWIRHADVKAFVLRCPDEVDLKKVEKWWFLDLLTDGRICR
jgi:hypothetical protein